MVVAMLVAVLARKYGAMLSTSRFLATNARMVVAMLVAVLARKYGQCLLRLGFYPRMHEWLGSVGSPENKTFVHSWLSYPRL